MKARPIIFSGPMVRALLDGRKTMTRRIVALNNTLIDGSRYAPRSQWWGRPAPDAWANLDFDSAWVDQGPSPAGNPGPYLKVPYLPESTGHRLYSETMVGDLLWVRETWAHYQVVSNVRRPDGRAFAEVSDGLAGYRADGHDTIYEFREHVAMTSDCDVEAIEINGDRWRPSIHMPRWASRITLRITDVRVERVQDISEEDARDEGVESLYSEREEHDWSICGTCGGTRLYPSGNPVTGGVMFDQDCCECDTYVKRFIALWNSINGPDAWGRNDWVWCVSFDVLTRNVDEVEA